MKAKGVLILVLLVVTLPALWAQEAASESSAGGGQGDGADSSFANAAMSVQQQLEASVSEYRELQEQIAAEKIPLTRKLNELEGKLAEVRLEYQKTTRLLDSRTLDLSNLTSEIRSRQQEATYLSNLLSEYIRNFESRLHIGEIQRYRQPLDTAKLAAENSNLSQREVYEAQAELLQVSLERLMEALGGTRYEGTATDASGTIHHGTFVLVGPAAIFRSDDGGTIGTVEQRLGSLEPTVIRFEQVADTAAASQLIDSSAGLFPLDPTLGSAHKIEETKETFLEHVKKGGPVMYPIFGLAGAALLVAVSKWLHLTFMRKPSRKRIQALLNAVAEHDEEAVEESIKSIKGPVGQMLAAGVEHRKEPRNLIEEVMYEKVLAIRLKLERFLPFIAISASSAPLLGLLGTVTGIINTFKLITVFGSGDVKMLSGGISEALITTEFGLIVAIPSLLLHAFLSRKAKGIVNDMEKAAVAFINQVSKTPYGQEARPAMFANLTVDQAQSILQQAGGRELVLDSAPPRRYSENSAGAFMNPRVISVCKKATVAEAIDKLRTGEISEDVESIYIVDEEGKYAGYVLIRHLLIRPENAVLESLAEDDARFVRADTHRNEVKAMFRKHDLKNMPVLDHEDRLIGSVSRNGEGDDNGDERD